jgi:AcrR family transcriptional regulator
MSKTQRTLKISATEDKPYHHGDLRNALIASGLAILKEQGLDGLNLREVARHAGVSHAAPYRHFADKGALIAAIAADGFRQLELAMRKALGLSETSTRDRLIALGQAYVRFAQRHPDHFRLMFSALSGPEKDSALFIQAKSSFLVLAQVVAEGQANGELKSGDPLHFSQAIWAGVHGLAELILGGQIKPAESKARDVEDLARRHVAWMLDGLAYDNRSNRSTSSTNTVAPPTSTSSG